MFPYKKYFLFSIFALIASITNAIDLSTEYIAQSPDRITTRISFALAQSEVVYKDFITLSTNHPAVDVISWQTNVEPVNQYIDELHTNKAVFDKDFFIDVITEKKHDTLITQPKLHLVYNASHQKTSGEALIALNFQPTNNATTATPAPIQQSLQEKNEPTKKTPSLSFNTWSQYLEQLIKGTDLLIVRILLIMLLGLLMSFTPCIYPMIPITIGIMQGQSNTSLITNFLHAFSYSIGIATTFSLLGLLAALSGAVFGMLLTNPLVVILIVAMLIYLALSMFGLYEISIPSFLQARNHNHTPSFISSFLFGALSGTVASPCVSPGLALVLFIVASLKNVFLGFLLLFSFGIGLSIPLLIIGTFSSSLTLLPRAGMWMIEIKKIFGFLLLGMSFYYLKNILPALLTPWLIAIFCAASGLYYLTSTSEHESTFLRSMKLIIGILFLTSSLYLFFQAYKFPYEQKQEHDAFWITNYQDALVQAQEEKKYLFFDFWAPSCSICTAIDKTLLKDTAVRSALTRFVPTKLELIMTDPTLMELKNKFNIIGLPAFILFDPSHDKVIKRWGGELYRVDKQAFIDELASL